MSCHQLNFFLKLFHEQLVIITSFFYKIDLLNEFIVFSSHRIDDNDGSSEMRTEVTLIVQRCDNDCDCGNVRNLIQIEARLGRLQFRNGVRGELEVCLDFNIWYKSDPTPSDPLPILANMLGKAIQYENSKLKFGEY